MHPGLARLFRKLEQLREASGLAAEDVEEDLVLGPGWVRRFESGETEPSLGTLAALLDAYGSSISSFFADLDLGDTRIAPDRHLTATQSASDLLLHFPMGPYAATVRLENATLDEFERVLLALRDELAGGRKREAIASSFLKAVELWPHANPSDVWYFLIGHAYQDDYNHPATEVGRDWGQSWKRASGWALEAIFARHYNDCLAMHGIRLEMPEPSRKETLLLGMGLTDLASAQKSDLLPVGTRGSGEEEAFGVIHVKASIAERRTDDVPLSQQLISRGYASPLVTMDCKANPVEHPYNRGELGATRGGAVEVSAKRLDIERDKKFDACFVYNTNTLPTPMGQAASARIYVCDFSNPNDAFSRHLVRKWRERQGLE
jgi:transcriptional regulator with XRE-family HTH domain